MSLGTYADKFKIKENKELEYTKNTNKSLIVEIKPIKNKKYDNRIYEGKNILSLYITPSNITREIWHKHYLYYIIQLYNSTIKIIKYRYPNKKKNFYKNNRIFNLFSRLLYFSSSKFLINKNLLDNI